MTGENIDAGALLVLIFHGVLMSSAAFMEPIYYFKESVLKNIHQSFFVAITMTSFGEEIFL